LAAHGSEAAVSAAIGAALRTAQVPLPESIEEMLKNSSGPSGPMMALKPFAASVERYNSLLGREVHS
jgi:hypothetical protein